MTNEEAIDFINNKIQIDVRFCSDDNINETKTALTLAIEALEKQIPKKVTEDEIIDTLECRCCVFRPRCSSCPHQDFCCIARITTDELNLIRKQQAEINRLKKYDEERDIRLHARLIANAKNEAIREFADRLKGMKYESIEWAHGEHPYVVEESDIDNLVEEMAGDK